MRNTDEEFDRLLNGCPEWLKPVVLTARHTGMRKENILSLKWEQVDLFRKIITLDSTKNGERLGIPLNDTMMDLFKNLARVRHFHSSYVFCHPTNGKRYYEVKTSFKEALEKVGIEDFRFHDLRHCFASALVQRGVNLLEVQKLLGHKTGRMTERYSHLTSANLRSAVLKLDQKEESVTVPFLSQTEGDHVSQGG
jgi:integrase